MGEDRRRRCRAVFSKGQGRGEEKKKYVLEFLASMGFTVDEEAINAAIEAAVNQLNGGNLPLE